MKDKLEALIKEAAALAKDCGEHEAAVVLHTLHGSMLCGQTSLMADFSVLLAQSMRDKLVEMQAAMPIQ